MKRKTIWISKAAGYYWISVDEAKGGPFDVAVCTERGDRIFKHLKIRSDTRSVAVEIVLKRIKK